MKHWTRKLNDVGKVILYRATDQENRLLTIKRMEEEIERLKNEYDAEEWRIEVQLRGEWTEDEIRFAKFG